jgi:hypothetical protein
MSRERAQPRPAQRPKLVAASEEMRRISALLAEELGGWPGVSERPMFGMRAFYRGGVVFAMLPHKRALENTFTVWYKEHGAEATREGLKWRQCEVREERQIRDALACLDAAYRSVGAGKLQNRRSTRSGAK